MTFVEHILHHIKCIVQYGRAVCVLSTNVRKARTCERPETAIYWPPNIFGWNSYTFFMHDMPPRLFESPPSVCVRECAQCAADIIMHRRNASPHMQIRTVIYNVYVRACWRRICIRTFCAGFDVLPLCAFVIAPESTFPEIRALHWVKTHSTRIHCR